jgi:hypothetical protein
MFSGTPKRQQCPRTKAVHGVNLDLLQTTRHRADGTARDPHAHHLAVHRAQRRDARRALWQSRLARLRAFLGLQTKDAPTVLRHLTARR